MLKKIAVFMLMCSAAMANPPTGTSRTIRYMGRETYQDSRGRVIGHSTPNVSGGRTYSDNRGVYSRSYKTQAGERFAPQRRK